MSVCKCRISLFFPPINRLTRVLMFKHHIRQKWKCVTSKSNLCPKMLCFVVLRKTICAVSLFQCFSVWVCVFFYDRDTFQFFVDSGIQCPPSPVLCRSQYFDNRSPLCEGESRHLINAFDVWDVRSTISHYLVCCDFQPTISMHYWMNRELQRKKSLFVKCIIEERNCMHCLCSCCCWWRWWWWFLWLLYELMGECILSVFDARVRLFYWCSRANPVSLWQRWVEWATQTGSEW